MAIADQKQTMFRELWATLAFTYFLHLLNSPNNSFPFHLLWFAVYTAFDRSIDVYMEISLLRLFTSWKNSNDAAPIDIMEFVGRIVAQFIGAFLGGWLAPLLTEMPLNAANLGFANVATDDRWRAMINIALVMGVFFWIWLAIPKRKESSLTRNLSLTLLLVATTDILNRVAPGAVVGMNVNIFRMIGYKIKESSLDIGALWLYIISPLVGFIVGVGVHMFDSTLGCMDSKTCTEADKDAGQKEEQAAPADKEDEMEV